MCEGLQFLGIREAEEKDSECAVQGEEWCL